MDVLDKSTTTADPAPELPEAVVPADDVAPEPRATGRTPYYQKWPEMIDLATKFIENNGFAAHVRRLSFTVSCGVSIPMLHKYLAGEAGKMGWDSSQIPSVSVIRRLLMAPNPRAKAAAFYHGLIDARRATRAQNSESDVDPHVYVDFVFHI